MTQYARVLCVCVRARERVLTFVMVVETQAELLSPTLPIGTLQLSGREVVQLHFLHQEGARHGDSVGFFSSSQTTNQVPCLSSALSRVERRNKERNGVDLSAARPL